MQRKLSFLLALVLGLSLIPTVPLEAQGPSDPGGGDAGNSRGQADTLAQGHHVGQLAANDPADWYQFFVDTNNRPKVQIFMRTDGHAAQRVDLFGPGDADTQPGRDDDTPTATGAGNRAQGILRQADRDGNWFIRITGGAGRYELDFRFGPEDDHNQNKDAPQTSGDAGAIMLSGDFQKGVIVHGNMTAGDQDDFYRFPVSAGLHRLHAYLQFPPSSRFDVEISNPAAPGVGVGLNKRVGPGGASDFRGNADVGTWAVRVHSLDDAQSAPYILSVSIDSQNDANDAPDAAATLGGGPTLTPGLYTGSLSASDNADAYRVANVAVGDRFLLGASSFQPDTADPTNPVRLQFVVSVYSSTTAKVYEMLVCNQAASIALTAEPGQAGTWLFVFQSAFALNKNCGDIPEENARTGGYLFQVEKKRQIERTAGDAPPDTFGAPTFAHQVVRHGWLDRADETDVYEIGHVEKGSVIRAFVMAEVPDHNVNLTLINNFGQAVTTTTSSGGVAGLHTSTSVTGIHFLRITKHRAGGDPITEGPYHFYADAGENEAPQASVLSVPTSTLDDGVTRTSVKLEWTENTEADFDHYEVHRSTTNTFTPSAETVILNQPDPKKTTHTASGLEQGRTYTFLVRTLDDGDLPSDSNRITRTTDSGVVGNDPPSLSGGDVSPDEGDEGTLFTWKVTYTDPNNDPPRIKHVFIDGVAANMGSSDTSYNDGAVFQFSKTLTAGQHSFFFEFDDDDDTTTRARDPPTGAHSGPLVTQQGNRPPQVDAKGNPGSGDAPLEVTFTADATDPDGDSISYCWDFDVNDGSQCESSQRIVKHTYEEAGRYTATVTVRDSKGATSSDSVTVDVREPQNQAPVVNPSANPDNGLAPLTVKFTAGAHDPDGSIQSYSWDFNNADGITTEKAEANPTHTYSNPGSFVATVTVRDNGGRNASGSVRVLVRSADNTPPSAAIVANPDRGPAPLMVEFEADSFDADGDAITHSWDFDMSDGVQDQSQGERTNHSYGDPGRYTALLTVRDARGAQSTATMEIVVLSPEGTAGVLFIRATPSQGRAPLDVKFQADTSGLGSAASSYAWDFGDGSAVDTTESPTHKYETRGTWTTTLTVTDADGVLYQSTIEINVTGEPSGSGSPSVGVLVVLGVVVALAVLLRRRRGA